MFEEANLFVFVAYDKEFFELVDDDMDGFEAVEVEGADKLDEWGVEGFGGDGVSVEFVADGEDEVILSANEDRIPVAGLELIAQAAVDDASFACARRAIEQHQISFVNPVVEFLGF